MDEQQLHDIMEKYNRGTATLQERALLEAWYTTLELRRPAQAFNEQECKRLLDEMRHNIGERTGVPMFWSTRKVRTSIHRWKYAAAAVLIAAASLVVLRWKEHSEDSGRLAAQLKSPADIRPGVSKATLTLANGQKLSLDSASAGFVKPQGSATAEIIANGQITYKPQAIAPDKEETYNTVTTPRGGEYQVVLSDGSKVWLNAESSITFPTYFTGQRRKVTVKGEAYFEVAHNAHQPFVVEVQAAGGMNETIEVLGTSFNIMAYGSEPAIETTLLEGGIKVIDGQRHEAFLSPGQQAVAGNGSETMTVHRMNVQDAVAWKNGLFVFRNQKLPAVMRQIERWYNVKVVYENQNNAEEFVGIISRHVNIAQILQMLQNTGAVKLELQGDTILIK